jgi:NAD(P)-dependent dehydrogenase (short-subunit alcohol dehydrogenase family)
MKLADRTALVTGSGRGIGKAVALRLAAEGAAVVTNARHAETAEQTADEIRAAGGRALSIAADVSRPDQVHDMFQRASDELGVVDVLVNNAGICPFLPLFEITPGIWNDMIGVDLSGVFYCSQACARHLIDAGKTRGRIVNITSISGERVTNPELQIAYCSAKGGANMLTKALAVALAPHGVTVNAVLPGTIRTEINEGDLADPATAKRILDHTPLRSFGETKDVAGLVSFLASEEAAWITGSLIVIDGGYILV